MYDLASFLGIPLPYAVGIMEMLWHYASVNTPRGDIGSQPDEAIKQACCFSRKAAVLVKAMADAKWIDPDPDHRYILHDWPDHCEGAVLQLLRYRKHDFLPVYGKSVNDRTKILPDSRATREAKAKAKAEVSSEEKKEGEILPPNLDEQFLEYQRLFGLVGNPIAEDFEAGSFCWRAWCVLDFEQRTQAVASLHERYTAGVSVLHKPDSYLTKREYKRPIAQRVSGNRGMTLEEKAAL